MCRQGRFFWTYELAAFSNKRTRQEDARAAGKGQVMQPPPYLYSDNFFFGGRLLFSPVAAILPFTYSARTPSTLSIGVRLLFFFLCGHSALIHILPGRHTRKNAWPISPPWPLLLNLA
jgi:hypothetical protein